MATEGRLNGRVALVTGGARGIGLAISNRLLGEGASVVAIGRSRPGLERLGAAAADRVAWAELDVTVAGAPRRAVELAVERFGRLDVLINNAGAFIKSALVDTRDEDIATMLTVNVAAPLALCREALAELIKTKGCIVNVSSAAAIYARAGLSAYGAAKAAIHHATRILAAELGPKGVRVNAVAPGMTRTDMTAHLFGDQKALAFLVDNTALGRVGEPDDVARVVAFLVSDDAGWVTGQTVAASGGLLL